MEPQIKPTSNGTQVVVASHGYNNSRSTFDGHNFRPSSSSSSSSKFLSSSRIQLTIHILRATTLILTFIAAIVMGTGKDRTRVSITNPITMKTTNFIETVRAKYSSALVYFIVTNVLMFLYSASSLAISFLIKEISRYTQLSFTISDILFLILLFSNNGASITTSLTMENGNIKLGWIKICDAVNTFCAHVTAAIVLSMFASIAHLVIVLLEATRTRVIDETISYIKSLEEVVTALDSQKKAKELHRYRNSSINVTVSNRTAFFALRIVSGHGNFTRVMEVFEKHKAEVLAATVVASKDGYTNVTATALLDGEESAERIKVELMTI